MYKRAIILAGGQGTRLKPYTITLPKPLVPVGDYPILEIIIRQLSKYGFTHVTITVNHLADIIQAFFGNGDKWNIKIDYSLEKMPLGTMGPLKLINDLPEDFLVMNGDILTDLNFEDFFDYHTLNKNLFTISSYLRNDKSEYGVLMTNEDNRLISFIEKPNLTALVSMGIYMVNKKALNDIPENTYFGFDKLMLSFLEKNYRVSVKPFEGYWLDIGRPVDYERAINDVDNLKFI